MSANKYVQALMAFGEAVGTLAKADENAWSIACADLANGDETQVNAYFQAATNALQAADVTAKDPRRVALRNHKSVLIGTLKRKVAIVPTLAKSAQEQLNAKARQAKREAEGTASPAESRVTIAKATAAQCLAAFIHKARAIEDATERNNTLRAAYNELGKLLPKAPKK